MAKGSLGDLTLGVSRSRSSRVSRETELDICPNIVEFIEAPWGLQRTMFPVQRVIVKAYYGLPLDKRLKQVAITDWRRQNPQLLTEAEYLEYLYSEGRSNISEVCAGDHRRDLVLAIGRRSGKCILGDSLVLTDRGILKVRDLCENPVPDSSVPLSVTVAQESGRAQSSHFYNGGVRDVRIFTTQRGYRLGGTDNHRIKVLEKDGVVAWKYLADLQVGDVVALLCGTGLWATTGLTEEEGRKLGESLGENNPLEIPPEVLCSPQAAVLSFLQAFLQTPSLTQAWSFSASCRELLQQVQIALLNCGVLSTLSREGGVWELSCAGQVVAGYFFDPVCSITESKEQVWDLTVPENHSFVANGVVNHNTEMAAWITAYEIFKLLRKPNPQFYYGIPSGDEIKLCAVATGKDQAGELYAKAKHYFLDCTLFDAYRANMTTTYSRFQTQYDIQQYGRYGEVDTPQSSVKATFYSSIAKGLRGAGNIVVVLDEIAHFVDIGQSSGSEVYKAVTPSIAAFSPKNPNNSLEALGPTEGRVILISSPFGKDGFFFQKYQQGVDRPDKMLCIQAPTWEVNPSISAEDLETFYTDDPSSFFTEFGAEFSDRTRGWLIREDLLKCIDPRLARSARAPAKAPHFMGIDIGVSRGGDGTAVAIGHLDKGQHVILDYMELIRAGEGKYEGQERLDFEEIADWLVSLSRKFHIVSGIMDRWAGLPMEQYLQKKGLRQVTSQLFTPKDTTFMYKTFKDLMWDDKIRLYNWQANPDGTTGELLSATDDQLCDYLLELLSLQEEKISRQVSNIEAPKSGGQHDDRSDALIRMVWLASQKMGNVKFLSGGLRGSAITQSGIYREKSSAHLAAMKRMHLGGSHPSRQVSRAPGKRNF
jgi:hypothetical protein